MASLRRLVCLFACALGVAGLAASSVRADEGEDLLVLRAGVYDTGLFSSSSDPAGGFALEYRSGWGWKILHPFVGVLTSTDGLFYGYFGLVLDIPLGERLRLSPSVAVGAFEEGGGRDLGHTVEFRSAVEFSYRFEDRSRVGVVFQHMSNAGLGSKNPGSESVLAVYAIPLSGLIQ